MVEDRYGPGTGVVWLSSVACRINDITLGSCLKRKQPGQNRCLHTTDVGVKCHPTTTPTTKPTTTEKTTTTTEPRTTTIAPPISTMSPGGL